MRSRISTVWSLRRRFLSSTSSGAEEVRSAVWSRNRLQQVLSDLDDHVFDDGNWPAPAPFRDEDEGEALADGVIIKKLTTVKDLLPDFRRRAAALKSNHEECTEFLPGKKVFGVFTTDPVKVGTSVLTAMGGLFDETECVVHVLHAVPLNATEDEVVRLFAKDRQIFLLREPKLTMYPDAKYGAHPVMVVKSPADVLFAGLGVVAGSTTELNIEGNDYMSRRLYELARCCYLGAIVLLENKNSQEFVVFSSNMAEAYLRMGRVGLAILETSRALKVDPLHVKSMCKRARALTAIQEHLQAVELLQKALVQSVGGGTQEIKQLLKKCEVFVEQSVNGSFDLSEYLVSGLRRESAPPCSDYVGPVEMKSSGDGVGRGLFVTRDVKLGEILVVSNPIGYVHSSEGNLDTDLVVSAVRTWLGSDKFAAQLNSLFHTDDVPELKIFRPNVMWNEDPVRESEKSPEVGKIKKLESRGLCKLDGNVWTGLWGLPSFINHSCMANVSRTYVGKTVFIRAARYLDAGDELRLAYVDALQPWSQGRREQCTNNWGFTCKCRRCTVEEQHQPLLAEFLHSESDAETENCPERVVEGVERALEVLKSKDMESWEKDRDYIRAGYLASYARCDLEKLAARFEEFPSALDVLRLLHQFAPGGERTLAFMAGLIKQNRPEQEGRELLRSEAMALFGSQKSEVVDVVIEAAAANDGLFRELLPDPNDYDDE